MSRIWTRLAGLAAAALFAVIAAPAHSDPAYPSREIRIIVPYAAGGVNDVLARVIGANLTEVLGQPVVVENKPGASGIVGSEFVKRSAPDGYTLLQGATGPSVANSVLYNKLPYDPVMDFEAVALIGTTPLMLYVNAKVSAKTLPELIALSKARPGSLTYGVGAAVQQMAMEILKSRTGADFTFAPYRGGALALTDVIGGHIQIGFDGIMTPLPAMKDGTVRGIAVSTAGRSAILPEVASIAEAGVADYDIGAWSGIFAPAGTPPVIVEKLNTAINQIIQRPAVREKLLQLGVEPANLTTAAFRARQVADIAAFSKAAKEANIPKLD